MKCTICNVLCNPTEQWTEEDALKEFKDNFGEPDDELVVVCHDCYLDNIDTILNKSESLK